MSITDLMPWRSEEREESPLYPLRRRVNRLFDEFVDEFGLRPFTERGVEFYPSVDITENEREIKVSAELPGLSEDDIDVSLTHNLLTIRGEKKAERKDEGENYYRLERSYGAFQRSIPLPVEVEADKVEATFKNGVLTITLPKSAEAQQRTKKITVKS
ncbi:MAG: Hsp20/alpha crystallin family protein [Phycisphaerae bacterium]|nr:Hsp20/alpha crystallin family protein [Phycisphaerae bacterium]NIX31913.1 Hsp20 family protein [Phycisphaerae bacterium]